MRIVSRASLQSLGSPLTYHKYAIEWLDFPTSLGFSSEELVLRVLSLSRPGFSIEKTNVEQNGFRVSFAGKDTFPDSFSMTILSTADGVAVDLLKNWKEYCVSTRTGGSVSPDIYKATFNAHSLAYDNETIVTTDTYHGVFPTEITPSGNFDTSVDAQAYEVTWNLDYLE